MNPLVFYSVIIAVATVGGGVGFGLYGSAKYDAGVIAGESRINALWQADVAKAEKARADLEAEHRLRERELRGLMKTNEDNANATIDSINRVHAAVVAGLRDRTQRPEAASTQQPADPATCPPVVCTGAGLYAEDAKFLIGEAARANKLRAQLANCERDYENARRLIAR